MSTLLHIDSSGRGSTSVTHNLTHYFAAKWKEANPHGTTIHRNLIGSNLPFVDGEIVAAYFTPENQHTVEQQQKLALSNDLLAELSQADTYVFGVPMYNFSVPAVFKAYIDLVVRAGKTFLFENGRPQGLLTNKKLIVITASGGDFSNEHLKAFDFVEPYIKAVMGFIGVTDVEFIKAHGSNPETIAATSKEAMHKIDRYFAPVLAS